MTGDLERALDVFDEAAWLSWRRDGIGGSDIAGVLGISPWASPYTVWADKVGLVPDRPATPRQRVGTILQDALADLFTETTGLYVAGEQTCVPNVDDPWIRCTAGRPHQHSP